MDRFNKILSDERYVLYLNKIKLHEKGRKFCKHNTKHFLAVSRIAYIMCLEEKLDIKKDIIYAIGFLHDIGRWQQYESKIPHEKASAALSRSILERCDYTKTETRVIISAIENHRNSNNTPIILNNIIYKSDKLSRNCFNCKVQNECDWTIEMKNLIIKY